MRDFLAQALREDIGRGDVFAPLVESKSARAEILAKEDGIFSGELYARELCAMQGLQLESILADSTRFTSGECIANIVGDMAVLLQSERVLLNILQHSSGIATLTREYVEILESNATPNTPRPKLLDTRKTRPMLRSLEKYSVRNGGGSNHRLGLDSLLMLKDTHLSHIHDLRAFIDKARSQLPFGMLIEVECESFHQAREAFAAGADIIMCDNMQLDSIQEVITLRNRSYPAVLIELSGNITTHNLHIYAALGADAISCGAIIHKAKFIDMSMKMRPYHATQSHTNQLHSTLDSKRLEANKVDSKELESISTLESTLDHSATSHNG